MRPSRERAARGCDVFIFRHVQKTGGVTIRHLFRLLESAGLALQYANGPT